MNDRSIILLLIAGALVSYAVYIGAHVPGMLIGPPIPVLLVGFVLQAVCAVVAAVGVWRRQPWAGDLVVLLGAIIAVTWLVEGFVLGIIPYLKALMGAVLAIVVAMIAAAYVNRRQEAGIRA